GLSIDSRSVAADELFWGIKGDRFDGNDFRDDAFSKGVTGFVSDNGYVPDGKRDELTLIKVPSSLKALQALAAYNRKKHPVPLVAVTGSNGKTTTKEIIASILKQRFEVLKNEGNLNNQIGVPLTLLKLHGEHEVAVVELGMNRAGEIRDLTGIARPDIGVITCIGEAHLEGLGSLENIKRAKGELIEAMEDEKTIVLNADDPALMELKDFVRGKLITFGINESADVMASDIEVEWGKGTLFILSDGENRLPVLLPLYGEHQLYNALAATAVAISLGFNLKEIREGLEAYEAYYGRMEILTEGGVHLINDSYNANPSSLRFAVKTMDDLAYGRKIVVLGDMLELGERAEELHTEAGRFIASIGVDVLVTVGPLAESIAKGAVSGGMEEQKVLSFGERQKAVAYLKAEIDKGDWILVKGSRGMAMEEVASELLAYIKKRENN
ncbi:MAG: UDP-N-acetylmuramoyl-tripeptide--D-alanyl-D-alanine ligase, partial [Proteobacteria bacterium]|nr:UDP-N-acetylmuramoyl-tripeptide--D-alanyl-D-alanine ligase [Pseudomonadota bacterium]